MNPIAHEFYQRLIDAIEGGSALGRLAEWLQKYTTLSGLPYSFRDHEFQVQVLDDTHHDIVVRKPSQVGMSETIVRMLIGFLATMRSVVGMMTLPTVHEAQRFSKSRIDPVIQGSKHIRAMLAAGSDSSSFKQIGSSQLFMVGTFGKAIISVPVDVLVCDEIDFSNPDALVTAESRLSHSRFVDNGTGVRGFRRRFSTPTLPDYGVSALFESSDQHYRLVRCRFCSHEFWPNFLEHVVVEGWDRPFSELGAVDAELLEDRGLVDTAQLLCESCHNLVDLSSEYRRWVPARPTHHRRGYAISPFDLPAYHSPSSLIRKVIHYRDKTNHFRNFALGLPYADEKNSILIKVVDDNTVVTPVTPEQAATGGVGWSVMGADIGKTSWVMIGQPRDGKLHILWMEKIRLKGEGDQDTQLKARVLELARYYRCVRGVIDSQPYTDTVLGIMHGRAPGSILAANYAFNAEKRIENWLINEKEWTVSLDRTRTIDATVKRVNSGKVLFPRGLNDMGIARKHFQGMKKVDRENDEGEFESMWVKTGDDHYFHSLNYLNVAASLVEGTWAVGATGAAPIGVTEVEIGGATRKGDSSQVRPLPSLI